MAKRLHQWTPTSPLLDCDAEVVERCPVWRQGGRHFATRAEAEQVLEREAKAMAEQLTVPGQSPKVGLVPIRRRESTVQPAALKQEQAHVWWAHQLQTALDHRPGVPVTVMHDNLVNCGERISHRVRQVLGKMMLNEILWNDPPPKSWFVERLQEEQCLFPPQTPPGAPPTPPPSGVMVTPDGDLTVWCTADTDEGLVRGTYTHPLQQDLAILDDYPAP